MFDSRDPKVLKDYELMGAFKKVSSPDILITGETAVLLQASIEYPFDKFIYSYKAGTNIDCVNKVFEACGFVLQSTDLRGNQVWNTPSIDHSILVERNKYFSGRLRVDHYTGIYIESMENITSDLCKSALKELTVSNGIALSVWWDDCRFHGKELIAQDEIAMTVNMIGIEQCRERFAQALSSTSLNYFPDPTPRFEGMLVEIEKLYSDAAAVDMKGTDGSSNTCGVEETNLFTSDLG